MIVENNCLILQKHLPLQFQDPTYVRHATPVADEHEVKSMTNLATMSDDLLTRIQ